MPAGRTAQSREKRIGLVPYHELAMTLSGEIADRLTGAVTLKHAAGRMDDFGNFAMPDFTVVNAEASYAVSDSAEAYLRIENLFDEDYETSAGYNSSRPRGLCGAFVPSSKILSPAPLGVGLLAPLGASLLAALVASALPALAEGPKRVVSINLCTDQLAMMLAAPGQLISVSHLATEVQSSSMVEEARAYPMNRGQVEQVFLMRPDMVLMAGTLYAGLNCRNVAGFGGSRWCRCRPPRR